jgi:PII-like signaling protein
MMALTIVVSCTSFSSFEFETYQVIRDGSYWIGVLNVVGSVLLGFAGVWVVARSRPEMSKTKGSTMLKKGHAKKVTIWVNEDARHHLTSLYEAILQYLLHKGVSGATASRAMAGFGPHHVMHTTKMETLMEHLPIRIEFIDTEETVDAVMPTLYDMVTDGLMYPPRKPTTRSNRQFG